MSKRNVEWSIVPVAVPAESLVSSVYPSTDLADAFSIRLPDNASTDPEVLARFIFAHQGSWVGWLIRLRDALVARFGIQTSKQFEAAAGARISFFRIYGKRAHEIILGEDDMHLDFRLSVLRRTHASERGRTTHLVLSTVVRCHNRLGRRYILLISPFHRLVVKSSLRRAARAGWPTAEAPRGPA